MPDDPDPIPRGTRGTVTAVSESIQLPGDRRPWQQIHVNWDNGRTLSLCTGKDAYRILPRESG